MVIAPLRSMPKPTFHNLPQPKRERFVEAALDEFARNPYDRASITGIVARLGIAKGSVYQYFDDKVDLFTWLVQEAGRRKVAAVQVATPDGPFLEQLAAMYAAGLTFWKTHPRWARLGLRLMEPSKEPRLEELRKTQAAASHRWLRDRIEQAIDDGELREGLEADDAAHLVGGLLSEGLLAAWLGRAGLDLAQLTDDPAAAEALDASHLQGAVDSALALLERGIAR